MIDQYNIFRERIEINFSRNSTQKIKQTDITSIPAVSLDNGTAFAVSSMPTLKADITSMPSQTVEVLAAPKMIIDNTSSLVVSSLPSVTVASQPLPTISALMFCTQWVRSGRVITFRHCDSSDNTSLDSNYAITIDEIGSSAFRPCFISGSASVNTDSIAAGHFFFCK